MGRIEEYIERIYSRVNKNNEETEILKEEMKFHLYDKVSDLMEDGYTEEESINIAIEKFGDENSISNDVKSLITNQTRYTNILFKVSIIVFVVGCLFKLGGVISENRFMDLWDENRARVSGDILNKIADTLEGKEEITGKEKDAFDHILNEYNDRYENGLYNIKVLKDSIPMYEYNREVSPELIKNGSESISGRGNNGWTISSKQTDLDSYRGSKITDERYDIKNITNSLHFKLNNIGFLLITLSWILIVMYYTQKAILDNNLNKYKILVLSLETIIIFASFVSDKDIVVPVTAFFLILNYTYLRILNKMNRKKVIFS
ncbi:permease prefix domain 1-containing protein [Clostridium sardiniense]|uniref:permease prefix domain 1-containing protein n=1 Tax=Clostridium sardiniense TaxID=29369 RepID=UPI003D3302C6